MTTIWTMVQSWMESRLGDRREHGERRAASGSRLRSNVLSTRCAPIIARRAAE